MIWIPYGVGSANLRYLVAHETAHQWFYGLVGNDQAREPFADEAAADFVARDITGHAPGQPLLDAAASIARSTATRAACYYEIIYIQGGNLLEPGPLADGRRRAFWSAHAHVRRAHRYRISTTPTLLKALDDATPVDLAADVPARGSRRFY